MLTTVILAARCGCGTTAKTAATTNQRFRTVVDLSSGQRDAADDHERRLHHAGNSGVCDTVNQAAASARPVLANDRSALQSRAFELVASSPSWLRRFSTAFITSVARSPRRRERARRRNAAVFAEYGNTCGDL